MTIYDDAMRTIIELSEKALKALSEICLREKISRAEAIRRAVEAYTSRKAPPSEEAFGIWRSRDVDSLEYQDTLRAEWVVSERRHRYKRPR
ncbi:MAG: ribbon-helix-helix protein, CopG family [Nitrospirota bacterium]